MMRKFFSDTRGNYALITAITMVPLMGALAIGVDYAEMNRQLQYTQNALDAAAVATAHRYVEGANTSDLISYANSFFDANLGAVNPADTTLTVDLPTSDTGGGELGVSASLKFHPYFYPTFVALLGNKSESFDIRFHAETRVRLKDTLEVALVLDNSGSMSDIGKGSGKKKIDLLKTASKQLIDTLVGSAAQVKQVNKPVQFGLVPFAASVNVGPQNANANWMDTDGISPIHHENFDWTTFNKSNTGDNRTVQKVGGVYYKKGSDWGSQEGQKVTRFTLYDDMRRITGTAKVKTGSHTEQRCTGSGWNRTCRNVTVDDYSDVPTYANDIKWEGCVEARPAPYDLNDAAPNSSDPATLYVPMFAPDETDRTDNSRPANNNYSVDHVSSSDAARQAYMPKYFSPNGVITEATGLDAGPNVSCTTKPITPLTDVTNSSGMQTIDDAIDAMQPLGGTNVPSGLAWGWRVVSSGAPFTEGRPESERGNDKVVIVLTDGANTYYTPDSVTAYKYSGTYWNYGGNDLAGSKALYSSYGYLKPWNNAYSVGRLFLGTSVTKSDFSNPNYTLAMNQKMAALCANAKVANVLVMTVSLDLDPKDKAQAAQMAALKACSSDSRFRMDPATGLPEKLYWNATGADLSDKFKEIANELSNLRIVS